ncbi:MAG: DsbE family thiol:disulfide interchange protein [Fimbriimonadaceae bacterium]|nr:DsbE family thiol:disulfide interchange protein [Alphaproteobacteria bacterium]
MQENIAEDQALRRPSIGRRILVMAPVFVFAVLTLFLLFRMYGNDPSVIPSALIGKPVPAFEMPPLEGVTANGNQVPGLSAADLGQGKVSVVNIWASWCGPCRQEHPFLTRLAEDKRINFFGINYKDQSDNARQFLAELGNPYQRIGVDFKGRMSIDWGVYGIPETFIVTGDGRISYKHVGPIDDTILRDLILPKIEEALAATPPTGE